MTDATATILGALIGFVGGLVVAAFTFRQKADELFLAGLQYLSGGSQSRSLGIAALQLSWSSRRHRKAIAQLLVSVASYLLLESKQKDAAHELENLRQIMKLLISPQGQRSLDNEAKAALYRTLNNKKSRLQESTNDGLGVTDEQMDKWVNSLKF